MPCFYSGSAIIIFAFLYPPYFIRKCFGYRILLSVPWYNCKNKFVFAIETKISLISLRNPSLAQSSCSSLARWSALLQTATFMYFLKIFLLHRLKFHLSVNGCHHQHQYKRQLSSWYHHKMDGNIDIIPATPILSLNRNGREFKTVFVLVVRNFSNHRCDHPTIYITMDINIKIHITNPGFPQR